MLSGAPERRQGGAKGAPSMPEAPPAMFAARDDWLCHRGQGTADELGDLDGGTQTENLRPERDVAGQQATAALHQVPG